MSRFFASLVAVLLTAFSGQVVANNNYFLPGDAFYYSEPQHEWFENLTTAEQLIVTYQMPRKGTGGRFCGYAGYNKLRLTNLTPEFRANLLNAYRELRSRYPQRVETHYQSTMQMKNGKLVTVGDQQNSRVEFNLVSMLIYNRSFDLQKFRPLFRYNETWADAAASFGHPRNHVAYDLFLDDAQLITDDWRDSPLVEPLKFNAPEPETPGKRKNVTITVDCHDIQVLLFPTAHYEDIAFPESTVVVQDVSGNRPKQASGRIKGGGMFAIQDTIKPDKIRGLPRQDAPANNETPFFAYRATAEKVEILKPKKKRWVVSKTFIPHSLRANPRDEPWWVERHAAKLAAAKDAADSKILLIGDSITHSWESHETIWRESFPNESTFNIGFSGDRTEHVLWRLENGAVDHLSPEYAMLLIGTNNTGHRMDPPSEIAKGIQAIIEDLKRRLPKTELVLFAVFPRGKDGDDAERRNNLLINDILANMQQQDRVTYVDIGTQFFSDDGNLTNGVSQDLLHLDANGYKIWAAAIKKILADKFGE